MELIRGVHEVVLSLLISFFLTALRRMICIFKRKTDSWWQISQGVLRITQDAYVYFQKILRQIGDSSKHWKLILNTIQFYKFCVITRKIGTFVSYNVTLHCVKVFVIFKIQNFVLMQPIRYFVPVPRSTCWSECSTNQT